MTARRGGALLAGALLAGALVLGVAVGCGSPTDSGGGSSGGTGGAVVDDAPGTPPWTQVSAGAYNACALAAAGRSYCWGFRMPSACTNTACSIDSVPRAVPGAPAFVRVAVGGDFACGVTAGGQVYCWGELPFASLGDGVTARSETPVRVAVPEPATAVAAGYAHACVLAAGGAAWCWGDRGPELGFGSDTATGLMPRPVAIGLRFASLSGGTTHTCGVTADGAGYCWGGGFGALGVGARDTACAAYGASCLRASAPALVDGGLHWASITAGNGFTCGVTVDGRGWCWGGLRIAGDPTPGYGVLGNGTFDGAKSPVAVAGGHRWRALATGTRHACGIDTDGAAWCWGNNTSAELGTGALGSPVATPQRVAGGLRLTGVALADVSCGVSANANLYCWGTASGGLLGNGSASYAVQATPARVRPPGG